MASIKKVKKKLKKLEKRSFIKVSLMFFPLSGRVRIFLRLVGPGSACSSQGSLEIKKM